MEAEIATDELDPARCVKFYNYFVMHVFLSSHILYYRMHYVFCNVEYTMIYHILAVI